MIRLAKFYIYITNIGACPEFYLSRLSVLVLKMNQKEHLEERNAILTMQIRITLLHSLGEHLDWGHSKEVLVR